MSSSPFITSALLHLVIVAIIWGCAGAKHPALPSAPLLYVDLASVPFAAPTETPAVQPQQLVTPQQIPDNAVLEPAVAAKQQEDAPAVPAEVPPAPQQPQQVQLAPEISQAFASASRMQEMMYKTRRYHEVAVMALRKALEGKLASGERRQLDGKSAHILAKYDDDAAPEYAISTESEELRTLLQDDAAWAQVPSPRQCNMQYKKVAFLVTLQRGAIQVGLSPE